jgi:hypothetical protein
MLEQSREALHDGESQPDPPPRAIALGIPDLTELSGG